MTLTPPGLFRATQIIDCSFDLLPTALPLKHRQPIHFHAATSELEAEALLRGTTPIAPGQSGYVRLYLSEPVLLLPGDRFIARMFSPVTTIGGGTVLDNHPSPHLRKPTVLARLPELVGAGLGARLSLFAAESENRSRLSPIWPPGAECTRSYMVEAPACAGRFPLRTRNFASSLSPLWGPRNPGSRKRWPIPPTAELLVARDAQGFRTVSGFPGRSPVVRHERSCRRR